MPICESCGREEREVTLVQRVYLVPEAEAEADTDAAGPDRLETSATPAAAEIERWCASCCATFPHTPVDPE